MYIYIHVCMYWSCLGMSISFGTLWIIYMFNERGCRGVREIEGVHMEESSAQQNWWMAAQKAEANPQASLPPSRLIYSLMIIDIYTSNILKSEGGQRMKATSCICTSNGVCCFVLVSTLMVNFAFWVAFHQFCTCSALPCARPQGVCVCVYTD